MSLRSNINTCFLIAFISGSACAAVTPPVGFTALYNGRDLSGWRGGDTFDHRQWLALAATARAQQDAEWTADMQKHWHAAGDELVNDGHGKYATTVADYGDFELLLDYRTVARADSGIYLRGCPQIQIWDYTDPAKFSLGADKGSGGLWNNSVGAAGKDPLVKADRPFGEWNHFRIVMVGARVTVWLNEQPVDRLNCKRMVGKFAGVIFLSAKLALRRRTSGWRVTVNTLVFGALLMVMISLAGRGPGPAMLSLMGQSSAGHSKAE